jgi:hypothetical protein
MFDEFFYVCEACFISALAAISVISVATLVWVTILGTEWLAHFF